MRRRRMMKKAKRRTRIRPAAPPAEPPMMAALFDFFTGCGIGIAVGVGAYSLEEVVEELDDVAVSVEEKVVVESDDDDVETGSGIEGAGELVATAPEPDSTREGVACIVSLVHVIAIQKAIAVNVLREAP